MFQSNDMESYPLLIHQSPFHEYTNHIPLNGLVLRENLNRKPSMFPLNIGFSGVNFPLNQWAFQDPKMEVLYHIRSYFVGIFPYRGLT
jgi:hypothetical protein